VTVVLDTNTVLQMFGARSPLARLKDALLAGRVTVAVSTGIWLEYEEVVTRYAGAGVWTRVARIFALAEQLHGNVLHVEPSFHFQLIVADADDDKFADCAIAVGADFVITEDGHFDVLAASRHRPRAISPTEFIRRFLP
jgi:putative PIN family toxin of toxin-antitoxin system